MYWQQDVDMTEYQKQTFAGKSYPLFPYGHQGEDFRFGFAFKKDTGDVREFQLRRLHLRVRGSARGAKYWQQDVDMTEYQKQTFAGKPYPPFPSCSKFRMHH